MDRVDVHRAQRINFLIDAHGADFRGHGRTDAARDQDGHHDRREFLRHGDADQAADGVVQAALDEQRAGLQRDHAAEEERQHANHQQTGVADLEELLKDLGALSPDRGATRTTFAKKGAPFHRCSET